MISLVLSLFALGLLAIGVTAARVAIRQRQARRRREIDWLTSKIVPHVEASAEAWDSSDFRARVLFPREVR